MHQVPGLDLTFQPLEVLLSQGQPSGLPPLDHLFSEACRLRASGHFLEAIQSYEHLLKSHPNYPEAVLNLGVCYLKLGEIAKARRLYILTEPKSIEITYNYAVASWLKGKQFEAISAFKTCILSGNRDIVEKAKAALEQLEGNLQGGKGNWEEKTEWDFDFAMVVRKAGQASVWKGKRQYQSLSLSNSMVRNRKESGKLGKERIGPGHSRSNSSNAQYKHTKRPQSSLQLPLKPAIPSSKSSQISLSPLPSLPSLSKAEEVSRVKVRRQGSLVEEDLEDELSLREKEINMDIERKIHGLAAEMTTSLNQSIENRLNFEYINREIAHFGRIRNENMHLIRQEMMKSSQFRDIATLSAFLCPLKFFTKFKPEVQTELLRLGSHMLVEKGEFVFKQGDVGTMVYVVLKGSIRVWRHAAEYGSDPLIVHTLYEGDSFGELSLFTSDSSKSLSRSASCEAVESTDLFYLPKEDYQRIMLREVEIGLQAKLSVLLKLPFFVGVHEFALIPLAATLTPIRFKIGEYVLKQGEIPAGLHIIVSGRCNVYSEGYLLRPKPTQPVISRSKHWTLRPAAPEIERSDHVITPEIAYSSNVLANDMQAFFKVPDLEGIFNKYVVFRERTLKTTLGEGGFFAGRCLVEPSQARVQPGKFSIVADSAEVIIYIITSSQAPLLGEKIAGQVLYILRKVGDVDCPTQVTREKLRDEFVRWSKYKDKMVTGVKKKRGVRGRELGGI